MSISRMHAGYRDVSTLPRQTTMPTRSLMMAAHARGRAPRADASCSRPAAEIRRLLTTTAPPSTATTRARTLSPAAWIATINTISPARTSIMRPHAIRRSSTAAPLRAHSTLIAPRLFTTTRYACTSSRAAQTACRLISTPRPTRTTARAPIPSLDVPTIVQSIMTPLQPSRQHAPTLSSVAWIRSLATSPPTQPSPPRRPSPSAASLALRSRPLNAPSTCTGA